MSQSAENSPLIESKNQLVEFFERGAKKRSEIGVGTEHEKFFICQGDHHVVTFDELSGLEDIFETLIEKDDWQPIKENSRTVGITKNSRSITLEPGGQVELSGAICQTIFETENEFDRHMEKLKTLVDRDCAFLCMGLNPFHKLSEIPLVPKRRFDLMWNYLPTRGELPEWMMKMTNTIQANFDFTSQADAVQMIRTALLISPVVSALFANSPIKQREDTGMQSFRGYLWTKTDPDRTGWPSFMYRKDWGFDDYVEYILDIPMFLIHRNHEVIDMTGYSFRQFIEEGWQGFEARMSDFETHLTTAFPEIRLKQYIEVRGADGGPRSHILGLPALWKGLLYDQRSRDKARALFDGISPDQHAKLFFDAYHDGLRATYNGTSLRDYAETILDLSTQGLDRLAEEFDHPSESEFLESLFDIVETNSTAADQFRKDWRETHGHPDKLIAKYSL